jgi:hypothetical protein
MLEQKWGIDPPSPNVGVYGYTMERHMQADQNQHHHFDSTITVSCYKSTVYLKRLDIS